MLIKIKCYIYVLKSEDKTTTKKSKPVFKTPAEDSKAPASSCGMGPAMKNVILFALLRFLSKIIVYDATTTYYSNISNNISFYFFLLN